MTRLTSKGQVTVPVRVRYALGLAPGDEVVFSIEDGRGVFRRATALDALRGTFPVAPRADAHALERLLVEGDDAFVRELADCAGHGARLRVPDAVLLELAGSLLRRCVAAAAISAALRDVLAVRAIRVDHPAALRTAIDELATGGDPFRAYALARG
jgi:AbrB family looped-hinge helix DNA binding protein